VSDDTAEYWRWVKDQEREERNQRLEEGTPEIEALRTLGYKVERIEYYQFRVNGQIDFYPMRRRWHHFKTGNRGSYTPGSVIGLVKRFVQIDRAAEP